MTMEMKALVDNAFILAAGRGSRLRVYTDQHFPKPAVTILDKPAILRVAYQAYCANVRRIYVTERYMPGHIVDAVGIGEALQRLREEQPARDENPIVDMFTPFPSRESLEVRHELEGEKSNTAGAVKKAVERDNFDRRQPFLVMSGDTVSPRFEPYAMELAFASARRKNPRLLGAIGFVLRPIPRVIDRFTTAVIDEDNRMVSFEEKPHSEEEALRIFRKIKSKNILRAAKKFGAPLLPVNSGYYLLMRKIFEVVPEPKDPQDFDFGFYLFKKAPPRSILTFPMIERFSRGIVQEEWFDLGYPVEIFRAHFALVENCPFALFTGNYVRHQKTWYVVGGGSAFGEHNDIGSSVIGTNTHIHDATIKNSIIGEGCVIHDTTIEQSVILPHTHINARPHSRRVERIVRSLVGGKLIGGSFVDGDSAFGRTSFFEEILVPDQNGMLGTEKLPLTDDDRRLAEKFLTD